MRTLKTTLALLILLLLPALFLWKLTLAGRILVGLDPFNFFYPYHDAVARAVAAGQLPEWNPMLFGGVPFLADSQAQFFYPLSWLFLPLSAPQALIWGITLHLAWCALGTYVWARQGLLMGRSGAWVAGAVMVLGGYLGAQIEHVNQLQAASWLPWMLLGYEWGRGLPQRGDAPADAKIKAISSERRLWGVLLGAVALTMSFLAGHTQTTFISLVMLGLWALYSAVRDDERTRSDVLTVQRSGLTPAIVAAAWRNFLSVNLVPLVMIVLAGALLASIQLIPTQQLSTLSQRSGGLSFESTVSFSFDPRILPRAMLPTFGEDVHLLSEYVAWIGFLPLTLALIGAFAPLLVGGASSKRPTRAARDFGLLASGTGLFLSFGLFNPVYWLLWRIVPGFDLFRAPARWLLLWAFGAAVLAGVGLEWWQAHAKEGLRLTQLPARLWSLLRQRRGLIGLIIGLLFLAALLILGAWPPLAVLPWWFGALGLTLIALVARWIWRSSFPIPYSLLVASLIVLELGMASRSQDYQHATAPEAYGGLRPAPAHMMTVQPEMGAARVLSLSKLTWDPGDLSALQARHAELLGEKAIYDLVVTTKLKEVLAPNQTMRWELKSADGYGGGLLPTARWVEFQKTLPLGKLVPDGRLREQLLDLPRPELLDVMGVEWMIIDKNNDWWSENIFHDLGALRPIQTGETLEWKSGPWQATALSFIVMGEWPTNPGSVTLGEQTFALADAEEKATRETGRGIERHFWLSLDPPRDLEQITLNASADWTLGGLTLVDSRLPAFQPFPANPAFQVAFSGDITLYQRQDGLGRAWIASDAIPVETPAAAATFVSDDTFNPQTTVIVEQDTTLSVPQGSTGSIKWLRDDANEIALQVNVPEGGWLVLADAPFPGWEATIDGTPTDWQAANVINRALYVPAGEHLVQWRYHTPGLQMGIVGVIAGLVVLAGWVWIVKRS